MLEYKRIIKKRGRKVTYMKIIASDFDNTFFVKDEDILKKNIEEVKRFIDEGNIFIIITGRSFTNIKKEIKKNKMSYNYLVCQDGANIFDKDDNCLVSNYLPISKNKKITDYLEKEQIEYSYESAFNDFDIQKNATKITITLKPTDKKMEILEKVKRLAKVYAYVSSKHINIIDSKVNKSTALAFLIKEKYIDDSVIVIGDDINDYEMMKDYNGVVMKKHDPILDDLHKEEIESVNQYIKLLKK